MLATRGGAAHPPWCTEGKVVMTLRVADSQSEYPNGMSEHCSLVQTE
jgi:hypothetical protein